MPTPEQVEFLTKLSEIKPDSHDRITSMLLIVYITLMAISEMPADEQRAFVGGLFFEIQGVIADRRKANGGDLVNSRVIAEYFSHNGDWNAALNCVQKSIVEHRCDPDQRSTCH